jgi:transposase InsO family protein
MAWKETHVMDERMMFVAEWLAGDRSRAEICRRYGVSRKTGYKLAGRYELDGPVGLLDRSRAPHGHPNAVGEEEEATILAMRSAHPSWGPKKIKARLEELHRDRPWPAASTIGAMLGRHGLVARRRLRRHCAPSPSPLRAADQANQVWGIDFKGWFRTGDGARCDPLSISDLASRYVIRLQAVTRPDEAHVWPVIEAAFIEFGLPDAMRSDNGPPFASTGAGGLSRLAVKLIKAGVVPERIRPGKPQQNGRHERLHRTLKAETAKPPAADLRAQQRRFDEFRRVFNEERPHEALGQETPASHFAPATRSYGYRLKEPEYPAGHHVRRVRQNGEIKWAGGLIFVSEALVGEPVGIEETDQGCFSVHFGPVYLGFLDHRSTLIREPIEPNLNPTPPR